MPCGGPGLGALSPAASGRGLSQGQPSALGPRVAPPVLRTLAVPSLLGVCLLRLGGGHGVSPREGRGRGQQGGSLCHPGLPDEALGQTGPLKRVRPQDGRALGRDDVASTALLLRYRRLPL